MKNKDIDTEFVIYPLALRLKLLGYDEPCLGYFDIIYNSITDKYKGVLKYPTNVKNLEDTEEMLYILGQQKILAPTWQSAFGWLIPHIDDEYKICLGKDGWFIYDLDNKQV